MSRRGITPLSWSLDHAGPMARTVADLALLLQALAGYDPSDGLRTKADLFEPDARVLLEAGELIYATDYIRALRARELIKQGWREMFETNSIDALLAPTLPATAVKADDPFVHWPDGTDESAIDAYVRTSAPGNLTGLPALSLPCGYDSHGLPIGRQIIGQPFDEPGVLRIGSVFEAVTDFANRVPAGLG